MPTASQKLFIDRYLEEKLPLDYWWMDAGWYRATGMAADRHLGGGHEAFPRRAAGDLRPRPSKGVKTIVWFEPERVTRHVARREPSGVDSGRQERRPAQPRQPRGAPVADRARRQADHRAGHRPLPPGFQHRPAGLLARNDAEDRQGITENHHVTGYLAYWDELRRRHPNMLIDSCASGGRRNDLETMRRAVPLLRSDYIMKPWATSATPTASRSGCPSTARARVRGRFRRT